MSIKNRLISKKNKLIFKLKKAIGIKTPVKFPQITPKETLEFIKDIIKDKIVCDIGCSEGDWMIEMSKYAKRVIGVDIDIKKLRIAVEKGLNVFKCDVLREELPPADIYYMYINFEDSMKIFNRIPAGKTVIWGFLDVDYYWKMRKDVPDGDIFTVGSFKNEAKYNVFDDKLIFSIKIINKYYE